MLARDDTTAPTADAAADVPAAEATDNEGSDAPIEAIWWGAVDLPVGAAAVVEVGPARVLAQRRTHEWRVYVERDDHWAEARPARARRLQRTDAEAVPDSTPALRASFADPPGHLVVQVAQSDRPVVVRPESPLAVQAGEAVTLFVSTPVWIAFTVARKRPRTKGKRSEADTETLRLYEAPAERFSDTWFGPNTRVGELCYATRSSGRLDLADLPQRPHRIVTPVRIENKATDALEFQRVQVPLPLLAVYRDAEGALWTNGVTLSRESGGDLAAVRVDASPPQTPAGGIERLTEPRSFVTGSAVVRAFGRLLRGEGAA
jgi:hypothetical protein